jgi:hypothetical protein
LETVNGKFDSTTGHNHAGTAGSGPKIPDGSLASGVATTSAPDTIAKRDSAGSLTAKRLISDIADGTAPLVVASSTLVSLLNADKVDGLDASQLKLNVASGYLSNLVGLSTTRITLSFEPLMIIAIGQSVNLTYSMGIGVVHKNGRSAGLVEHSGGGTGIWTDGTSPLILLRDTSTPSRILEIANWYADGFGIYVAVDATWFQVTWFAVG